MAGDTPSNHSATLRYLKGRQLDNIPARLTPPANIQESFCSIVLNLNGTSIAAVQAQQETIKANIQNMQPKLQQTLFQSFQKELDFDTALFKAFGEDLASCGVGIEAQEDNNIIVLSASLSTCGEYAFGFARQGRGKAMVTTRDDRSVSAVYDKRISARRSEYDHLSCLFKKEGHQWKIQECISVVELKMSDTSSKLRWEDNVSFLQEDPIVQEVDYALESTWPSICRSGLGEDIIFLPLAMIAAHRIGKAQHSDRSRWIKGRLFTPDNCGDRFGVQPCGVGGFDQATEADSLKDAAALYVETMLFGLELCNQLKECEYQRVPPSPSPLSGAVLKFGTIILESAELCGSPLLSKEQAVACGFIPISQGELYRVETLQLTKDCLDDEDSFNWLVSSSDDGDNQVSFQKLLVKVWAQSVHQCLQQPMTFELAAETLLRRGATSLIQELSSVLLGFCSVPTGTITLMHDLTANGTPVCLEQDPSQIGDYWGILMALVNSVLLPLADIGLIHQDLRPGFDLTANILIVQEAAATTRMRLIDFESLCRMKDFHSMLPDKRYPISGTSAHTFLYSQCAGIAHAWLEKVKATNFDMKAALQWAKTKTNLKNVPKKRDDLLNQLSALEELIAASQSSGASPGTSPGTAAIVSAATVPSGATRRASRPQKETGTE